MLLNRPYLVIPKLIEQPTWGGTYILEAKGWQNKSDFLGKRIGQSYELYDKSNLSFLNSSEDENFLGETADPKIVEIQSKPANSVSLNQIINEDPIKVLGKDIVSRFGTQMRLLLKFTQALGNSFQLHVPVSTSHDRWKPKPESWYYFEPGLITCGVKNHASWLEYELAIKGLDAQVQNLAKKVQNNDLDYDKAKGMIDSFIRKYDPWQYVNLVQVNKGSLLDLSACGIHHSWEENLQAIPLGNVLFEIQLNIMDDVSTIRNFDKGKMSKEGKLRPLNIEDYFAFADRSEIANNPKTHLRAPRTIRQTESYHHERILETTYYLLDRVRLSSIGNEFTESIDSFRHVFVRCGTVELNYGQQKLTVTNGHSAFIPAACCEYSLRANQTNSEILISY